MDIKPNNHIDPASRIAATPVRSRPAGGRTDSATFDRAQALEQALQLTPAVRPENVDRARQLLSDVKYPPDETIRKIATLLAMNLESAANAAFPEAS